jgi:hypothetical protein
VTLLSSNGKEQVLWGKSAAAGHEKYGRTSVTTAERLEAVSRL